MTHGADEPISIHVVVCEGVDPAEFIYGDQLTLEQHLQAVDELFRVAAEIRVFPVTDMQGSDDGPELHRAVRQHAESRGWTTEFRQTSYEVLRGANQYLQLTAPALSP